MSFSAAAESQVSRPVPRIGAAPSFRDVYRSHYTFVWRSLLRLGVHEGAVDDAVQDVFIVVHRKLDAFEGRAAVRTWLFAIARRIALRYRDRARRTALDDLESTEAATDRGRPDTALSCNETLRKLQSWLEELDEDKRAVFVLSEFEQMRAPEIAKMLGVNLNTVYARLRAARQHVARRARREANMETYRASVRTVAETKPAAGTRRRTWSLLAVKLGITKAAVATTGVGASAGILSKLAVAAAVVGGSSVAIASVEAEPPARTDAAVIAGAETAAVDPATKPMPKEPVLAPSARPAAPPPVAASVAPAESVPLAPSAVAWLAPAKQATKRPSRARVQARDIESKPEPFAAELERFELAKVAARRGDTREALNRIDRYVRDFPRGTFTMEASALRIRTLCKGQRTEEARKAATEFSTRFPSSTLIDVDAPCG
ncbi:MAG: sigma-70 family RNA polymerase sigma factor [Myxococcota bacterium]